MHIILKMTHNWTKCQVDAFYCTFNLLVISAQQVLMAWTSSWTLSSSCEKKWGNIFFPHNSQCFKHILSVFYLLNFFKYPRKVLVDGQAPSLYVTAQVPPCAQAVFSEELRQGRKSLQHLLQTWHKHRMIQMENDRNWHNTLNVMYECFKTRHQFSTALVLIYGCGWADTSNHKLYMISRMALVTQSTNPPRCGQWLTRRLCDVTNQLWNDDLEWPE